MLTCQGCMRHCLQYIIGESALLTSSVRPTLTSHNKIPLRRSYTGTSYERSSAGQEASRIRSEKDNKNSRFPAGNDSRRTDSRDPPSNRDIRAPRTSTPGFGNNLAIRIEHAPSASNVASARVIERRKWLDSRGIRPVSKKGVRVERTDFEIRKHLKYLNDPLKLADYVRQTLRREEFEVAQEVVRAASKTTMCVVSWNHLVEWQLTKGRMNAAISTYNEMKKRAQAPDAYTYTIIFRGCAEHPDSTHALPKVLDIYNSMLDEKSKIKPNAIHMNCVLKMCARADNMDALFGIAGQFARHGLTAPNNLSFTIILNALRMNAVGAARSDLSPMEKRARIRQNITRSRDVWADIVSRWRKGDMWIDEELVATMGRLLMAGQEDDQDDVFSLVEQTMNIPRQVPKFGTKERARIEPAKQQEATQAFQPSQATPEPTLNEDSQETDSASNAHFEVVEAPVTKEDGIAMYAKPGQNSLSLILQVCLDLHLKAPATAYWNIFTKTYLVQPDSDNYHAYLRILRVFRASTEMIEILSLMSKHDIEIKTFRLAMSTCARDKRNPNSFSNAEKVLDLMAKCLPQPDVASLEHYLSVAIDCPAKKEVPNAQGLQILLALSRLSPHFINLKAAMQFTSRDSGSRTPQVIEGTIELARGMIRAYDLLTNRALVPRERHGHLTEQRKVLSAFITRNQHHRGGATSSSGGYKNRRGPDGVRSRSEESASINKTSHGFGPMKTWMAAGV
ncbi:uncharacterized protein RCO7_10260 [Rhynchosporium graminicola]|uniref:Pentatricopeptide repeat protein n=1 Tax=Rhynchosporium graminicola TaxID=2792576 RepID=A0A1E1LAV1_9HELO|nr:uncharacterized protein RCO7_10260 [Rhynchosporium commune]